MKAQKWFPWVWAAVARFETIPVRSVLPAAAMFLVLVVPAKAATLGEALDATNLVWTTGGDAPCVVQHSVTRKGNDAVRSGLLGKLQQSWLDTQVTGPCGLTFWTKIDCSTLTLWMDVTNFLSLDYGPETWRRTAVSIPAGTHTLRWVFAMDGVTHSPAFGWIDAINFPLLPSAPKLLSQPIMKKRYLGNSMSFDADVEGYPEPSYQWYRNGQPIWAQKANRLYIYALNTNDSGFYSVVAQNQFGSVTSTPALFSVLPNRPPVLQGKWPGYDRFTNYDDMGYAWRIGILGNHAVFADGNNGVQIVDISNPQAPRQVASNHVGLAEGLAISGHYAYSAEDDGGLRILDLTNPVNPVEVGRCVPPGWAFGVTVSGSYAYVSAYYGGLQIVDVANPSQPKVVGGCGTTDPAHATAISGDYAYVAAWGGGLDVINIANRSQPFRVANFYTGGAGIDVAVSGRFAFLADHTGLRIFDISNPHNPMPEGFFPCADACAVALAGDFAYVVDDSGVFHVVDVSVPAEPLEAGRYAGGGRHSGIALSGNLACVTDLRWGLMVFDIAAGVSPIYRYTTNNGTITITGYMGPGGDVSVPRTIDGLPVTDIEKDAFRGAPYLTSITLGNTVTNIGDGAFAECPNLASMTVDAGNLYLTSLDGVLFNRTQTELIQFPGGKGGSYTLPENVISIRNSAFSGCTLLTGVTIGASVSSIGSEAFHACQRLTGVYFLGNAPTVAESTFAEAGNVTAYYLPWATGWGATLAGSPTSLWLSPWPAFSIAIRHHRILQTDGSWYYGGDFEAKIQIAQANSVDLLPPGGGVTKLERQSDPAWWMARHYEDLLSFDSHYLDGTYIFRLGFPGGITFDIPVKTYIVPMPGEYPELSGIQGGERWPANTPLPLHWKPWVYGRESDDVMLFVRHPFNEGGQFDYQVPIAPGQTNQVVPPEALPDNSVLETWLHFANWSTNYEVVKQTSTHVEFLTGNPQLVVECDVDLMQDYMPSSAAGDKFRFLFEAELDAFGADRVTVTTPVKPGFPTGETLELSEDGPNVRQEWGLWVEEPSAESLISRFPDGAYTYKVWFPDGSSTNVSSEVAASWPPSFPKLTPETPPSGSVLDPQTQTTIAWEPWIHTNAADRTTINLWIDDQFNGGKEIGQISLPANATSYTIGPGVLYPGGRYRVTVEFEPTSGAANDKDKSLILQYSTPPLLHSRSLMHQPNPPFFFQARSVPGAILELQASTNLTTWETISTVTNQSGYQSFAEWPGDFTRRFFRLKLADLPW